MYCNRLGRNDWFYRHLGYFHLDLISMTFVAGVFVVSALAKIITFEATVGLWSGMFQNLSEPLLIVLVAVTSLCEVACGIGLLQRTRLAIFLSLGLLFGFCIIATYLWLIGAENCSCFGAILAFGPQATLLKNAALMVLLAFSLNRQRVKAENILDEPTWRRIS